MKVRLWWSCSIKMHGKSDSLSTKNQNTDAPAVNTNILIFAVSLNAGEGRNINFESVEIICESCIQGAFRETLTKAAVWSDSVY